MPGTCNFNGCNADGDDVYDYYGIYAGRWCEKHEHKAPGQWAYNSDGELSSYELYGED